MKISKLKFTNFKYVPNDKYLSIDLEYGNSLIMGGANGYGKTTIFDTIELLITGEIKHFNSKLVNRGESNYSELANDQNKDIIIECEIISNNNFTNIKRVFNHSANYSSLIYKNGIEISSEELFAFLGINMSLFNLGVYISQLDSLNFLQQKYKDRKSSITSILDNSEINSKIATISDTKNTLKEKFETAKLNINTNIESLKTQEDSLAKSLQLMISNDKSVEYKKLFLDKDYLFDKEHFGSNDTYETVSTLLDSLISFIQNLEAYTNHTYNLNIESIMAVAKNIYLSLYYAKEIQVCINNKQIIDHSSELLKLKNKYDSESYFLNTTIIESLNLSDNIVSKTKLLIDERQVLEKNLTSTQGILNKLIKNRKSFISEFISATQNDAVDKNRCPLCGRISEELNSLFSDTEDSLSNNLGISTERLKLINDNLKTIFTNEIMPNVDNFLLRNSKIIHDNNLLKAYFSLSTDDLKSKLSEEKIVFTNTNEIVDLEKFEEDYKKLIEQLKLLKKEETSIISDDIYTNFTRIKNEYYPNNKYHTVSELTAKKYYISSIFVSDINEKLGLVRSQLLSETTHIENVTEKYKLNLKHLETILTKYKSSLKQYETSIANNIDVPMFIFSGKIIQNYPLGLGVSIVSDDSSILFKASGINTDIFNSLSTGQLNGVIISLLLSVKEVFGPDNGFNVLLIDDPLQTIDDISAISLIDLLSSHFKDTQIMLSTHESDKEFLIRSKYEQSGNPCKTLDMQKIYLEL